MEHSSVYQEIEKSQVISNVITQYLIDNGLQILVTLIILAIGYVIAKKLGKAIEGLMVGKNIDVTLSRFVGNSAHLVIFLYLREGHHQMVLTTKGYFDIYYQTLLDLTIVVRFNLISSLTGINRRR